MTFLMIRSLHLIIFHMKALKNKIKKIIIIYEYHLAKYKENIFL